MQLENSSLHLTFFASNLYLNEVSSNWAEGLKTGELAATIWLEDEIARGAEITYYPSSFNLLSPFL